MRKRHFFALLCAILLLLSLFSCKRKEEQDGAPAGGDNGAPSTSQTGEDGDGISAAFAVRFDKDGVGFDTDEGTLFTKTASTSRDFSGDLEALRFDLTEHNACEIGREHSDLTYKTLSGGSTPTGPNALYTVWFTLEGNTYTITIDDAAIAAYGKSNHHVSNIGALVDTFVNLTAHWNGAQS